MIKYFINANAQSSGEHEVHRADCEWLEIIIPTNRLYLGTFDNCKSAVTMAEIKYPNWSIDGCKYCSPDCHKK